MCRKGAQKKLSSFLASEMVFSAMIRHGKGTGLRQITAAMMLVSQGNGLPARTPGAWRSQDGFLINMVTLLRNPGAHRARVCSILIVFSLLFILFFLAFWTEAI